MPTTINASNTSGGAIITPDGSGVLELQSGGVTGLTVSGANVTVAGTLAATGGIPQITTALTSPVSVIGNSTAGAEIRLPEDTDNGANYVAIKAPNALAANLTFTLPTADGTNGQFIRTDGAGQLSFATVSPGGTTGQIQFNNAGVFGGVTAVPVANGGTGATTLTGVVKGNGTSAFTAGTVSLTAEVSGTLPVANGGTGAATLTANNVLLGNGTSALQAVAPGTAGNLLTSNGTTWTSAAAPAAPFQNLTVVASSGTFTIPAGITTIKVTVVGGGGGGGGQPGIAGSAGGNTSLASGTQTISTITGNGGAGGPSNNGSTGGAGGSASGGNLNFRGDPGQSSTQNGYMGWQPGGSSFFGGGGQAGSGGDYGGGGAGVSSSTTLSPGGGGGGGGTAISYLKNLTSGNTLTVTIGSGGSGSTSGGNGVVVIEY